MGLPVEVNNLMLGSLGGYTIGRSVRLRSSATAWFSRTAGVPTNQYIWTVSFWTKLAQGGAFIGGGTTTPNWLYTDFGATGMQIYYPNTGASMYLVSNALFRDPSAWYHVVLAFDSTQATPSNRVKFYVNGVQLTLSTTTYPAQNSTFFWNQNGLQQRIGSITGASGNYDGYLAEFHGIDGQALTPSSFGAYDNNGVWQPRKYVGTYGANGFYLNFSDNSAATAAAIGKDYSGNGNNWTPNNISLTAGTTYDSMIDSPTVSASSSNYAVLNVLDKSASLPSPTNGNLSVANAASAWHVIRSTIAVTSGKWYAEVTQTGSNSFAGVTSGLTALTFALYTGTSGLYAFFNNGSGTTGYPYANGTSGSVFTIASGDVIGLAYDYDAQTLAIYRNGTLQATVTSIPKTDPMFFCAAFAQTSATQDWNFGQRPFTYTPPTGFKALNTYNLPAPSIANGAQYFDALTWSGSGGSSRSITGLNFQPDFVWSKVRNTTYGHMFFDSVRGAGSGKELGSNSTGAEGYAASSQYGYLSAFNSNGFTVTAGSDASIPNAYWNQSGNTYVGWQWKGGGTGVTNTAGTITSTVSASPSSGFSIATFTGTGAAATVGHGLGVAPSMIIVKCRSNAGTQWPTYHVSMGATKAMNLDATSGAITYNLFWNNTAPTSSVFSIGSVGADTNINGATFVAYCFAAVSGYSAFGSYTGNGSSDGPFIYTGFRARWVMIKATTTAASWVMFDTARSVGNVTGLYLCPNLSQAEAGPSVIDIDVLSNGFKLRNNDGSMNTANTYIYAAFAENPFQASRAR